MVLAVLDRQRLSEVLALQNQIREFDDQPRGAQPARTRQNQKRTDRARRESRHFGQLLQSGVNGGDEGQKKQQTAPEHMPDIHGGYPYRINMHLYRGGVFLRPDENAAQRGQPRQGAGDSRATEVLETADKFVEDYAGGAERPALAEPDIHDV